MIDPLLLFHIVNGLGLILAANACANLSYCDNRTIEVLLSACGFAFVIAGMILLITAPFAR